MKLAGLQKLSLVDFPGQLSCAVFVQGCNFHCPYCQNPDLIPCLSAPSVIPAKAGIHNKITDFRGNDKFSGAEEENIFDFLKTRKNIIEGVVITGGEPVIFEDLPVFIEQIKKLGFKIKLDTNGSNPDVVKTLLSAGLLDYIALDIKTSFSKYSLLTDLEGIEEAVGESSEHIKKLSKLYEFRTTCVPGIVNEEDFYEIGKMVKGARKHCLQQFRPFRTYKEDFQKVEPYQKKDFIKFQDILKQFVETVELRAIE